LVEQQKKLFTNFLETYFLRSRDLFILESSTLYSIHQVKEVFEILDNISNEYNFYKKKTNSILNSRSQFIETVKQLYLRIISKLSDEKKEPFEKAPEFIFLSKLEFPETSKNYSILKAKKKIYKIN
jgi:hypothetical protein